jgi:hypothetical protein
MGLWRSRTGRQRRGKTGGANNLSPSGYSGTPSFHHRAKCPCGARACRLLGCHHRPRGHGQSVVLRAIIDAEQQRHGVPQVGVTAPTGLAAVAINGSTIHSWAGWSKNVPRNLDDAVQQARSRCLDHWLLAKVLVVDEVSMLDGNLLDLLEQTGRRLRQNDLPFGGLKVVLCGDFCQLPPATNGLYAFESVAWQICNLVWPTTRCT